MTIEYALTRTEIVKGYFRSLLSSPRYLTTILLYALGFSAAVMIASGALSRNLALFDAIAALMAAVAFILILPVILFIRAKTSMRSLTVSSEGISTEIGSLKAHRPWCKIKIIQETSHYVLIAAANGNAFYIPVRAFSAPEQKAEFVTRIKGGAFDSAARN